MKRQQLQFGVTEVAGSQMSFNTCAIFMTQMRPPENKQSLG